MSNINRLTALELRALLVSIGGVLTLATFSALAPSSILSLRFVISLLFSSHYNEETAQDSLETDGMKALIPPHEPDETSSLRGGMTLMSNQASQA
jgi:hypothetical protein